MKKLLLSALFLITLNACTPIEKEKALGTLERDRVTFSATANEIIRELPVKEGNMVNEAMYW
ncbi:predicted membrane fusion protein (MFP) component of efflux pump [Vibrio ponticus]|nr:predicted membrane fusion protein (MFP) component of efflux pump [Vibrio ponticus]